MPLEPDASSGWYGATRATTVMRCDALVPLLMDEFEIAGRDPVSTEVADEREAGSSLTATRSYTGSARTPGRTIG